MADPSPRLSTVEAIVRAANFEDGPSAAAFEAHVRERGQAEHLADLYVAYACASGSQIAARRLGKLVMEMPVASRRSGIPEATVDDARQIVFERLVSSAKGPPKIAAYDGRGPLLAWLRVTLAREALYLHKQRATRAPDEMEDALVAMAAPEDDPELGALKEDLRVRYREALRRAARTLTSRDRALLRQHLALGMTVDAIGPVYGVHRATAARWIASARQALIDAFYVELKASTGIRRTEADTLRGLIQSRFDLSLASLLQTEPRASKGDE